MFFCNCKTILQSYQQCTKGSNFSTSLPTLAVFWILGFVLCFFLRFLLKSRKGSSGQWFPNFMSFFWAHGSRDVCLSNTFYQELVIFQSLSIGPVYAGLGISLGTDCWLSVLPVLCPLLPGMLPAGHTSQQPAAAVPLCQWHGDRSDPHNCLKGSFTWVFSLSFLQTEHRTVAQGMADHPFLPAKVSLPQHLACRDTPPREDHSGHRPFNVIHWGAVCQSRRLETA